jgi:exonuclease I
MTDEQRANISKGRREGLRRKRMSEGMKASWARRRHAMAIVPMTELARRVSNEQPRLYQAAIKYLGAARVKELLANAIMKDLLK